MILNFQHKQLASCENGTICNLLKYNGIDISEALLFGIGSGLYFAYVPFLNYYGRPISFFRIQPGKIQKNSLKRLGIELCQKKYSDKQEAMDDLDRMLENGQPVGLFSNLYYLPYFPETHRLQFNMHQLVVYGKEGNKYYVSDPVLKDPATIEYQDLLKARFANGVLTLKGNIYYPGRILKTVPIETAIIKGIKSTCRMMTKNIIPYHGTKGIKMFNKRVEKEILKGNQEFVSLMLGDMIRMLEEIGTGGAGFRYIYSAFLKESGQTLKQKVLEDLSLELLSVGDRWRDFASVSAKIIKGRIAHKEGYDQISEILSELADSEYHFFTKLNKVPLLNN
jgi:hypothetical protein